MTSHPPPDSEKAAVPSGDGSIPPQSTGTKAAQEQDIAIAMVGEHRSDIDPAVETRVLRKIDLFLVPAMFIGYGLVYYDKV